MAIAPTIQEGSSTMDLESSAEPSSARLEPEVQPPQLTHSPQPSQPLQQTPNTTCTAETQNPTYAVLHSPAPPPPPPTLKSHQPAPLPKPTLTIDGLHRRFHNKPSPFKLDKKTRRRSAKRARNKAASATQSLSRFLNTALPAFSRFLAEMQPNWTVAVRLSRKFSKAAP